MPAKFVISLDFELAWGSVDKWCDKIFLDRSSRAAEVAMDLLNIFKEYNIACTWATVGALMCEDKNQFLDYAPKGNLRPTYSQKTVSPYKNLGLINESNKSSFFCPDVIRAIIRTPNQELGSHTFCHYYCLEEGQTAEQFNADIKSTVEISREFNHENKSLVFPRNQINTNYLEILLRHGFISFRGPEQSFVWKTRSRSERTKLIRLLRVLDSYLPFSNCKPVNRVKQCDCGLLDIPSSRFFRPRNKLDVLFERLKLKRMKDELKKYSK